ncbi:hypothetical protein SERLA73DRAFT_161380 [Serpula lacrymans var. lacrymans S7.3]|uniref:Uncharacterized protein n=1 Tax=Serpula lacrymans var. lacrymans (strain S7.3) TaxID=936435 RepID=F8Q225_SERL3|nr:hypothetical protein SERLA73DRAFT_161380 [Serpula lacrymans var. lacrymans S7.3]
MDKKFSKSVKSLDPLLWLKGLQMSQNKGKIVYEALSAHNLAFQEQLPALIDTYMEWCLNCSDLTHQAEHTMDPSMGGMGLLKVEVVDTFSLCQDIMAPSWAFNLYMSIRSRVKMLVRTALNPCTYTIKGEEELKFRMLYTMDGNDSLKKIVRRATPEARFVNFQTPGRLTEIDNQQDNMVQSGELAKYPLAVVEEILNTFGEDIAGGFDINCLGLENLEGCERAFSKSNTLAGSVQYAITKDRQLTLTLDTRMNLKYTTTSILTCYFKACHAHEEIKWLNVEICQVATYLRDKDKYLQICEKQICPASPALAYQIRIHRIERGSFNAHHVCRLLDIAKLLGFSGMIVPGESTQTGTGESGSVPMAKLPSLLVLVSRSPCDGQPSEDSIYEQRDSPEDLEEEEEEDKHVEEASEV